MNPKPAQFRSSADGFRCFLPEVTAPVDERRRDEHERKREKRRQAEVELQIIPHVMQGTLRQKGGAVASFGLPAGVGVRSAVLGVLVLRWCLEKKV